MPRKGNLSGNAIRSGNAFRLDTLLVLVLGAFVACKAPPDPRRTNFEIRAKEGYAKYDPKTGRLQRLDADQNKNGRFDTFSFWDGSRLLRTEIDQDEDGKIDRWELYDGHNKIARVGSSSRDDEVQDTWAYPDAHGFLAKVETDSDRDGTIDKRETFVEKPGSAGVRVLRVVELEIDETGSPSRRLYFLPDGNFDRAETLRH